MKISIELEIAPDEVPMACELLRTLRLLTEHVKGAQPVSVKNVRQVFEALVGRLADESQLDAVAAEVTTLLEQPSSASEEYLAEELIAAFETVVFDVNLVLRQQSVVPFMSLLPKLPEPYKTKVRDGLIQKVLQHLTKKRPINADRTQFFAQAEAFAVLVQIEFVSVDGAAQTIGKLLGKPDTRSAAVTMLGKTMELCSEKVLKCAPKILSALWQALEQVTEEVFKYDVDWITQYMGWSNGPAQAAALPISLPDGSAAISPGIPAVSLADLPGAGVVPGSTVGTALKHVGSYQGHTNTIFTICYDKAHQQVISGGKDNQVIVWSQAGEVSSRINVPDHYVCSMDIHPTQQLLLLCGVVSEPQKSLPPCIQLHDTVAGMSCRGTISRPGSTLISCLRCFTSCNAFITGETISTGAGQLQEQVCYYELPPSGGVENLKPVRTYAEHESLVTCVAVTTVQPNAFVSGSRDATIRVWDRRMDRRVAVLGIANSSGFGMPKAHNEMITCLDTVDNMLLSTGVDGMLCFWDLRRITNQGFSPPLNQMGLDGQPILKVALTGAPSSHLAAVSTFSGLYLVDFRDVNAPLAQTANLFSAAMPNVPKHYHDIKWAHGQQYLYAAGESKCIDLYSLV